MTAASYLGIVLSFLLPAWVGGTLLATLWRSGPTLLRGILGAGLGLGLCGATWMSAIMISGSSDKSLMASEGLLLLVLGALVMLRMRRGQTVPTATPKSAPKARSIEAAAMLLTLLFAIVSAALILDVSPNGDYDAVAIWNSKARFLYLSDRPVEALVDLINPDYPVLLPSLIARSWQYSGQDTVIVPIAFAAFFTAASTLVLVGGLRLVAGSTAFLAGCVALSTPMFITSGTSQYADIYICFFITTAIMLYTISDSSGPGTRWLPLLSGLSAGFAACIKNEGTLFVVVMVGTRLCLLAWERRWKADGFRISLFLAGLVPGILSLVVFRALSAKSQLFSNMTAATIATRLTETPRHFAILQGFARDLSHFGNWWINPLIPMVLYIVIQRFSHHGTIFAAQWRFPAIVLTLMLCAYYGVYLFSPYDLVWHVQSSFPRLLVQLWPTALTLWALLATGKTTGAQQS